jgi:UDP-N-acetylglucosamine:LPS N-acetylglucosamine transferase
MDPNGCEINSTGSAKALFFSRGRGRGHAIPDIALVTELLQDANCPALQFVSYGTGADTIRQHGYHVIDLELSEESQFAETLIRCAQAVRDYLPNFVISHEEFAALPAAQVFGVPCIFLIDWFPRAGTVWMECLRYARSTIFMDDPGYYDEPDVIRGKIKYVGPVIRDLNLTEGNQRNARIELGLPRDRPIVMVLPGGSSASSEANSPLFDLVSGAIDLLDQNALTIWIDSAKDRQAIVSRIATRTDFLIVETRFDIEKFMVAADVVITKGTRKTSIELNALGIPSISISHGLNPIDDYRVLRIKTNRALRARGLTTSSLSLHISEAMRERPNAIRVPDSSSGRIAAAGLIREHMKSIESL